MSKHGAVDWQEPVSDPSKRMGKDSFLRLKPGHNILRLVSLPHLYNQHRYEPDGGKKYGYRITCSRSDTEKNCPLCEMGNVAKKRWYVAALEAETNTYKILDMGVAIFKAVQSLAQTSWGSPDNYDVDITVNPQGGAQGYYYVAPMPPVSLTAAQIAVKEEGAASTDLQTRCEPPTPAKIQERLNKIQEEIDNGGEVPAAKPSERKMPASSKPSPKKEESSEEEEEDFFTDYSKKTT